MRVRPLQIQTNVFFHASHFFRGMFTWETGGSEKQYGFFLPNTLVVVERREQKKSIDRCDPNHAAAVFPGQGGHRVQKRHDVLMLFEFGSEINDFDTNLQSLWVRNRNILGVWFKSMSLKPMVRHLRTMQAGSFSQFEAKLTDASSRLQVVCVDDGLTRW
jgi:hypothetical protein